MSVEAIVWAKRQRTGSAAMKALLFVLADYADENGSCFPGQERLATETEQSVRTVRDQLHKLADMGLIRVQPGAGSRSSSGGRKSNRYFLALDKPANLAGYSTPPSQGLPANPAGGLPAKSGGGYRQPVAADPSVEPPGIEPPGEGIADGTSAAPDGGLFDAPKPPAKKPGREPDPVNVQAKALADHWVTLANGMANFLAARGVAVKALRAGHAPDAVRAAMDRLYASRVPLTATSLDIEVRGGLRSATPANGYKAYQDSDYWSTT